ncbi:NAD(P)-dependent oxidoreductase [Deinococcus sp. 6GRE01]|uniref:NAD(P)-dependent oxidoreductase n=1 Tax=Deinococcus sp. 6GRE01 TaxID=2745873 RepID=UPI001E306320|nr:NAD(P)H-binding protein [Deinococcus sp. 6GRE01]MCD0155726.1 NAD(P)H-binding protein [Deinococcus sp. 6GRE01]
MKIGLLGGTGRTGQQLLRLALDHGHSVHVLARTPARLTPAAGLTAIRGDVSNRADVAEVVSGVDVVLSALGPVRGGSPTVMQDAAAHLVSVMPAAGVLRLVTLTGAGVEHAGDQPGPVDRVFRGILRLTQGAVLADATRHVDLIRESPLQWTVVRAPMLKGGPAGPVVSGPVGRVGTQVTRASVAAFMLAAAEDGTFIREAPAVSQAPGSRGR